MRASADAFLAVTDGERRGEGRIDHRRPFGATAKLVKTAQFSRARVDLDLSSQRGNCNNRGPDETRRFSERPESDQNAKSPRTEIRGLPVYSW
jgi:hypothetical protein